MRVTLALYLIVSLAFVAYALGSNVKAVQHRPSSSLSKSASACLLQILAKTLQTIFRFLIGLLKGPVDAALLRRGIVQGNVPRVRELLFMGRERLQLSDNGAMALFLAVTHNQPAVTRFLLDEYGVAADVHLRVGHRYSVPVYNYLAIINSHSSVFGDDKDEAREQIIKAFVAKMPELDAVLRNKTLADYSEHEQAHIINGLLTATPCNVLSKICAYARKTWRRQGGVNALYGPDQLTLLHEACVVGSVEVVKGLLAEGASPLVEAQLPSYIPFPKMAKDAPTRSKPWTPIAVAVAMANQPIVELLMAHVTEVPSCAAHPLDVACDLSRLDAKQAMTRALKVSNALGRVMAENVFKAPKQFFYKVGSWTLSRSSNLLLHKALTTGNIGLVHQALLTQNCEGLDEKCLIFTGNEFESKPKEMVRIFEYIANTGKIRISSKSPLPGFQSHGFYVLFNILIGPVYWDMPAECKERLMKALGTMLPAFLPIVLQMCKNVLSVGFFRDALTYWYPIYKANDPEALGLKSVLSDLDDSLVRSVPPNVWRDLGLARPAFEKWYRKFLMPSIYD
jgi:hypothetical protein